jgi:prepilin-type N-terminal cleavage/methylation domain-containing protein
MTAQRQAYTLLEVIITMAILVVGTALVLPSITSMGGETRVLAGADMVKSRLAEARARAVEEGRPYRFEIVDTTHCRITPDVGDPAEPTSASASDDSEGNKDTLPANVSFDLSSSKADAAADDTTDNGTSGAGLRIVFLPNGSAREDAEIRVTSQGGRPAIVHLRALTGTTSITRDTEGKRP